VSDRYDLVVLGGGTAGLVSAVIAAGVGARVALVERDRTGGDCLWTGCVPSKSRRPRIPAPALPAAAADEHERRDYCADGQPHGFDVSALPLRNAYASPCVRTARIASRDRFASLGHEQRQDESDERHERPQGRGGAQKLLALSLRAVTARCARADPPRSRAHPQRA